MSKVTKEKLERKLNKALKNDNYEKIIKLSNQLLKFDPNDFKYWMIIGKSYGALGKYDDAVDAYKKAIDSDPNNEELYYLIIEDLESLELLDDAFEIIDKGLKINPNNINLIDDKTMLLYDHGHEDEAYKYIDSFSEDYEYYDDILEIKAKLKEIDEDFESAMELYTKVLENGKSSHALMSKVELMEILNFDNDEILKFLETFYDNEDLRDTAIMFVINFYLHSEGGEKALSFNEELYEDDLENPRYKWNKCTILFEMEKFDEAEKSMMEFFENGEIEGEYTSIIEIAGRYLEKEHYDRAIELLDAIPKDSKEYKAAMIFKKYILNQKENSAEKFLEKVNSNSFDIDNLGDYEMNIIQNDPALKRKYDEILKLKKQLK
ncbi:MAG: tetratricopeptide repeat protein [Methanobrevibacter sp.]|jgi:tetratricopeptide (TPR) repeat protein|nr:tetratricopeptide repeat protein [Candidatus Methanoflexus mossambicus]